MKQPKKLTREQKEACSAYHLNSDDWMLEKETDFHFKVIHKATGKIRYLDKFIQKKVGNRCILREGKISA